MTTETFMLVAPYEWPLKNVERNARTVPKTFASKMILFRGERVFRVGLKNDPHKQTLFLMSINLNKIGLNVKEVVYWYNPEDSATQSTLASNKIPHINMQKCDEDGSLQLFTSDLDELVSRNGTFFFRIYIEGLVHQYCYQMSDRLLKKQLWAAVKNQQHGTDVELLVLKGEKFSAHKAILAARSPVFAAKFLEKRQSEDVPYQLKIDNVDPSTVEQFLYFLYTGESMTPNLANKELLKLAEIYELTTLTELCRNSLKEVNTQQMAKVITALQTKAATECPLEIKQEKEMEIFFDQNISVILLQGLYEMSTKSPLVLSRHKNEDMFFFHLESETKSGYNRRPVFTQFISANLPSFGFKAVEVSYRCDIFELLHKEHWNEMKRQSQEMAKLSLFTSTRTNLNNIRQYMHFHTKVVSTIENNCFEMVDTDWAVQLWSVSTKRQLTDVDVIVGEKKLEAHRVILCVRSPVFCTLLSKISNTGKPTITIGAEFELANVEQFLKFLYTGSLDILANKQLLALAELYEVETLKKICRAHNQNSDVEDLTNSLLGL